MSDAKVHLDLSGMEALASELRNYRARVGVIGAKAGARNDDSGMSNGELAVLQIFGSDKAGIPPRDFLLMPIEHDKREIMKELGAGAFQRAFTEGDVKKVFSLIGLACENAIQRAFGSRGFGRWAPNAPSTIDRKGSSMPLIDTAELRRSVTSTVVDKSKIAG